MKRPEFKTLVSMEVDKKRYERDLKQPLKELGYNEKNMGHFKHDHILITYPSANVVTNLHTLINFKSCGHFIDHYNPKLFLALAAMTDEDLGIKGEWWKCVRDSLLFENKNLYQAINIDIKGLPEFIDNEGDINGFRKRVYHLEYFFRKATKEELIEKFSKGCGESDLMERLEGNVHKKPQPIVEPWYVCSHAVYDDKSVTEKEKEVREEFVKKYPLTVDECFSHIGNKYVKEIRGEKVDVYDVLTAYKVTCPARAHAIKKLLMAGQRGHKDEEQDLKEAIQAIERSINLNEPE